MNTKYTKEELDIVNYIEQENPKSIPDLEKKIKVIKKAAENKVLKRKAISLRILEDDLNKIKKKALHEGIPYQTLIGSVIHKYVNGTLS